VDIETLAKTLKRKKRVQTVLSYRKQYYGDKRKYSWKWTISLYTVFEGHEYEKHYQHNRFQGVIDKTIRHELSEVEKGGND